LERNKAIQKDRSFDARERELKKNLREKGLPASEKAVNDEESGERNRARLRSQKKFAQDQGKSLGIRWAGGGLSYHASRSAGVTELHRAALTARITAKIRQSRKPSRLSLRQGEETIQPKGKELLSLVPPEKNALVAYRRDNTRNDILMLERLLSTTLKKDLTTSF